MVFCIFTKEGNPDFPPKTRSQSHSASRRERHFSFVGPALAVASAGVGHVEGCHGACRWSRGGMKCGEG